MKILLLLLLTIFSVNVAAAPVITSPFGWRVHPVTGDWKFHTGIDIGMDYGEKIQAMMAGKVVYAAAYGGYGNCIILAHPDGDHTLYAHCSWIYCRYGQEVDKGETIAAAGDSGIATGVHLHLEYWHNGQYADPLELWGR